MKTMEQLRRGMPAAAVMAAGLVLSGCGPGEESAPGEAVAAWKEAEQQLTAEGSRTALQIYEATNIDEKEISVDVTGLDYGERAATVANAVFEETGGDAFRATSKGVTDGEHIVSLELGNAPPFDGAFSTRQLESASALVCTTVLANGMDITPNDPIAKAVTAAREQEGDAANESRRQVVFGCMGRLATEIAPTDAGTIELAVPIGQ